MHKPFIALMYAICIALPAVWAQKPLREMKSPEEVKQLIQTTPSDTLRAMACSRLAYMLMRNAPDSSDVYAQKAIGLAQKFGLHEIQGNANLYMGIVASRRGDAERALALNLEAYAYGQKSNVLALQAMAQGNIANIYYDKGDFQSALKGYRESAEIFETLKDTADAATGYINIASLQVDNLGEYDPAIETLRKSLALLENTQNYNPSLLLALTYLNFGLVYQKKQEPELSLGWLLKSLQMYRAIGDKSGTVDVYPALIEAYITKKEYDRALTYAEMAIKTAQEVEYEDGVFENTLAKASALRLKKDFPAALQTLQAIESDVEKSDKKVYMKSMYDEFGLVYKGLHKRKFAKQYSQKAAAAQAAIDAANAALKQEAQQSNPPSKSQP